MLWTHNSEIFCGGSVYKPNVIITAGHCCKPFELENGLLWNETTIIAAELEYGYPGQVEQARSVKSHKIHPGGFQLEFVSISRVINHMTCYKFKCSHWLKLQHSDWRANLVKDFCF